MEKYIEKHIDWIDDTLNKIDNKLKVVAARTSIPPYTAVNGKFLPVYKKDHQENDVIDYSWWTNGFWGGLMWIMYSYTKDPLYMQCALNQEKSLDKAYDFIDGLHHDVGFMWHITSGANYRITGDATARTRNLLAAALLGSRYNIEGNFIRAWNGKGTEKLSIIDTLLNLPLLYWASFETNDDRFLQIANAHMRMVMDRHIRGDGSVAHIISHDMENGTFKEVAGQGYAQGSSWSRGQGWAIYGFALAYVYTKNTLYLDVAKKVAHYFIACVCDDYLPKVDFRSPYEPTIIDSTASGIAACGLIEIAKAVPEYEKKLYIDAAIKLLKALDMHCANYNADDDPLLMMGTQSYHNKKEREIPIIYGDFYYVEALYKLKNTDFLIW